MARSVPFDDRPQTPAPMSPLVEAVLSLAQEMVRRKFGDHGADWTGFALGAADQAISRDDFAKIEGRILQSGHRFDWSARISVTERPEVYKPLEGAGTAEEGFSHPDAPQGPFDDNGQALAGAGDNVVRHEKDISGIARFIRTNERVLSYLTEGVPPGTIAVIDDSGGTLTAPIIEQFTGVICAGGTVRSHLGILTREYNIPCVMNAKIAGIRDGDTVTIESSAAAKTTEDYQQGIERVARIWRARRPEGA